MKKTKISKAFTLVELLVVMAILAILATVVISGFRSAQMRGKDAQRKSDLKQITNALELFYQDYGKYPRASGTQIAACPYINGGTQTACTWGLSELRDVNISTNETNTTYLKTLPKDPLGTSQPYIYKVDSTQKKYQLYARLENTEDKNIIPGITQSCGTSLCNYSVTSTNTNPTETLN